MNRIDKTAIVDLGVGVILIALGITLLILTRPEPPVRDSVGSVTHGLTLWNDPVGITPKGSADITVGAPTNTYSLQPANATLQETMYGVDMQ